MDPIPPLNFTGGAAGPSGVRGGNTGAPQSVGRRSVIFGSTTTSTSETGRPHTAAFQPDIFGLPNFAAVPAGDSSPTGDSGGLTLSPLLLLAGLALVYIMRKG